MRKGIKRSTDKVRVNEREVEVPKGRDPGPRLLLPEAALARPGQWHVGG